MLGFKSLWSAAVTLQASNSCHDLEGPTATIDRRGARPGNSIRWRCNARHICGTAPQWKLRKNSIPPVTKRLSHGRFGVGSYRPGPAKCTNATRQLYI
jgi:hypothetical protein